MMHWQLKTAIHQSFLSQTTGRIPDLHLPTHLPTLFQACSPPKWRPSILVLSVISPFHTHYNHAAFQTLKLDLRSNFPLYANSSDWDIFRTWKQYLNIILYYSCRYLPVNRTTTTCVSTSIQCCPELGIDAKVHVQTFIQSFKWLWIYVFSNNWYCLSNWARVVLVVYIM